MSKSKEGLVGLNYPMRARNKYTTWSLKMKVFMQSEGVWQAIESDYKKPQPQVEERTDKMGLAIIYQGIPEDILLSVAEKKSAKEAWEAIRTMCVGADKKAKVQTLRAELESLTILKDTEQIDDFCLRLGGIGTNIRVLGEKMEESYVVTNKISSNCFNY